ncbi:Histidine phosphatase superfamily clade-2 [Penicillium sp. IBT 18751x]|nr:Histidine phosphatase superfamily clade-2 [Penicillium sp. IBT 18751x]
MFAHRQLLAFALCLQASMLVTAQDYGAKVWGVFAYTVHGESIPTVLTVSPGSKVLTEFGANQLQAAGSSFRDRYVPTIDGNSSETAIVYLPPDSLNAEDVSVLSMADQYVSASAQAFMQGLYPPLGESDITSSESTDNATIGMTPLDGYQYAHIITLGEADPSSVMVDGSAQCDMHQTAEAEYKDSSDAMRITKESVDFYVGLLDDALGPAFDATTATYRNSPEVSEYMDYEAIHNSSFMDTVSESDLSRARWLADQYTYATNGQDSTATSSLSTIGQVNAIAGQTLASSLLDAFDKNIEHFGAHQQMTLLFGNDAPAVALASLMGMASQQQSNFYSRPTRGASLIFELYSFASDEVFPTWPGTDNLYVRFYLHNGTDVSTEFQSFSFFGYGPSIEYVPWTEFKSELETFAVSSTQEWCTKCDAQSIFCNGVLNNDKPAPKKQMQPAVAGVIGAVVTLVAVGLLTIVGFLICGCRKHRMTHKPSIGGFKGNGKLASDTDVTFRNPIWGGSKAAGVEESDGVAGAGFGPGHERLGSWEMGQQKKEFGQADSATMTKDRVPMSVAWDEMEEEWRIHSGLQPVKARESV